MDDIKLCAKKERKGIGDFDINNENIQRGYGNRIRDRKICNTRDERRKRQITGEIIIIIIIIIIVMSCRLP